MERATFLIQYPRIMFILFPLILLNLTALVLICLRILRVNYRYSWILAGGGATLALIGIFLWHFRIPETFSLHPWLPLTRFPHMLSWLINVRSWPYAISMVALAVAVIFTSVVRADNHPTAWAGTLLVTFLGILAVAADNPLTLILAWTAIDLVELIVMLRSTDGGQHVRGVVGGFAARAAGSGLVLWAVLIGQANGTQFTFQDPSYKVGILLLFAMGLRLGSRVQELPLPEDNVALRKFGIHLQLVSAAATLSLLGKISTVAPNSTLSIIIIILVAITACYSAWRWMRSSDGAHGRSFWVLAMASLSLAGSLIGNPTGSVGWGVMLVFAGGLLFFYSARQKSTIWLPFLGLLGFSTLPFTVSATAWQAGNSIPWYIAALFIPAQTFLMAGFIHHALQHGEEYLEYQERWVKVLYPIGLFLLAALTILLGLWGWDGAFQMGRWWSAAISFILAIGFALLPPRYFLRIPSSGRTNRWRQLIRFEWFSWIFAMTYAFFDQVANIITSSLEGDGGVLWSLLLMVLVLSVLSARGW
jgi:hypothetical protein